MNERVYHLWLSGTPGVGSVTFRKLVKIFGSPKAVFEATQKDLRNVHLSNDLVESIITSRKSFDGDSVASKLEKKGIGFMLLSDPDYPALLKEIYDPPAVLYVWGSILPSDETAFGVVGSRRMTMYGREVTHSLTYELASAGLTIVSGLAKGVDATAHRAAIDAGGRTIAVLGGGIFKIYPTENEKLAAEIANGYGAVISEFAPDEPSVAGNFPSRNRIISGLSVGILVTEAAVDSGSLITATSAAEQNREVFAVPGPITSPLTEGPASLIQTGAKLVFRAQDILDELNIEAKKRHLEVRSAIPATSEEQAILDLLELEAKHLDQIVRESGQPASVVSGLISIMELKGMVRQVGVAIWAKVS